MNTKPASERTISHVRECLYEKNNPLWAWFSQKRWGELPRHIQKQIQRHKWDKQSFAVTYYQNEDRQPRLIIVKKISAS